jgi:hypothetical protein
VAIPGSGGIHRLSGKTSFGICLSPGLALVAGCAALSHAGSVVEKKTEQTAIGEVIERLTHRHPTMSPLTIADVVQKMHAKFDGRPIRDFVPLFVERNARAELAKLGG